LLGHQTPLCGEHSRLNGCPVSLDHYTGVLRWDVEGRMNGSVGIYELVVDPKKISIAFVI